MYYNDNDSYPTTGGGWSWEAGVYEGAGAWIPDISPNYFKILPSDPRKDKPGSKNQGCVDFGPNMYGYVSDGTDYKVYVHCTPENYGESSRDFIDPWRDADATWGGDGVCADAVIEGENAGVGDGLPWGWAIWSSDTSKCW